MPPDSFLSRDQMLIEEIQTTETSLSLTVRATHPTSCCPLCSQASSSIHSHYQRMLNDASCVGRQVQLTLIVRRFYCRNRLCERKVFTEHIPRIVKPWARMTTRLSEHLQAMALATSGRGGIKLAVRLGMQTDRQTLLRRMMALPDLPEESVLYLGRDDFAFRRGQRFGTVLVNLETHHIVDLRPLRQAETAAAWMRQRPDITVVSRDRGGEYAKAAADGAPQATDVADRFHILKNLTEALQLLLGRSLEVIKVANQTPEKEPGEPSKPVIAMEEWRRAEPAHVQKARLARRSGRYARYQQVVELQKQGMKRGEIARHLGMGERTVHRWLASSTFPETRKRRRQNAFEPFAPYVLSRWKAGERNGLALWREIKEQGYKGSARSLYPYLETLKQAEGKRISQPAAHPEIYSQCCRLARMSRDPKDLEKVEQEALAAFCQASTQLRLAYDLVQDFFSMVHKRQGYRLDAWLERVASSDLSELQSFATGVERDKAAVQAGLTWWINNGVVEGSVTKVKRDLETNVWTSQFCTPASTSSSCFLTCLSLRVLMWACHFDAPRVCQSPRDAQRVYNKQAM
jgi:transposase